MIKYNKFYFFPAIFLLAIELSIRGYVHDTLIKSFGDYFIKVSLMHCLLKSFTNAPVLLSAVCVLVFSYAAEVSQYFHLVFLLGFNIQRPLYISATVLSFSGSGKVN